ncbi:MAG: insulinase family protein, partial [Acidobacteriota bacterium]|nr:insulinase family protein [Acidobacteriota bacterium]
RFLTADNATLAVVGNVKPDLVYRAVRRYFGAWTQADKKIPATFRQPDAPDTKVLTIEIPNLEKTYSRTATNAAARIDKDFYATQIVAKVWQNEACLTDESNHGELKYEAYFLHGEYFIRQSKNFVDKIELPISRNVCPFILVNLKDGKPIYPTITQNNFEQAKSKIIADLNQKTQSLTDLADLWLDVDTYKLASVKDELQKANNVTFADVQRVSDNLQKQPFVNITVKKSVAAKQ